MIDVLIDIMWTVFNKHDPRRGVFSLDIFFLYFPILGELLTDFINVIFDLHADSFPLHGALLN